MSGPLGAEQREVWKQAVAVVARKATERIWKRMLGWVGLVPGRSDKMGECYLLVLFGGK